MPPSLPQMPNRYRAKITQSFADRRKWAVISACGFFATLVLAGPLRTTVAAGRPNVVLIMADDLGYECLGCYGSASYQTPHLDRLASEGIRFDHCYAQPLCTPSRVKIMTGRYNFRNYVEFGYLDPRETTLGQVMQRAGYRTCIAGKWQLNGLTYRMPRFDDPTRALEAGFDEALLWQLTQPKKLGERYADALVEMPGEPPRVVEGGYGPQEFADFVCDFIERNREEPFFVYYPMALVHAPFVPTPDSPQWSGDRHQKSPRHLAAMVAYMDKIVGQIDQKLDELGLRENTLLVFTGDNGTTRGIESQMTDGRTIVGGKGTPTDAGTRVPLVVSWPKKAPSGAVRDDLIDFTDFFATISAAAGVPEAAAGTDGVSFLPQLRGEPGTPREHLFCHYEPRWGARKELLVRFVRDRRFKLFADGRLYDLVVDPLEQQPISAGASPASDQARMRLQNVLDSMPEVEQRPPRARAPQPAAAG